MRHGWASLLTCGLMACMPSQLPSRQISEVARDLNLAARFGRMDIAIEHTAAAHHSKFLDSRADWGTEVRVVDVEVAHLELETDERANVLVDVAWVRMNEGLLRATRVKQGWENSADGWKLATEERLSGDLGLLGERVSVLRPAATRDVHFPSKTIR